MIPMVDHEPGHTAVDADVLPRDEPRHVGAEVDHHVGDIGGIPHPPGGLLGGVGAFVDGVGVVDPARGDGIDPHAPRKAHGQGVGEGRDAALGGGVALGLGLAHAVAGGGDVDNAGSRGHMGRKELGQVKGGGDSHAQGVLEVLVAPRGDARHERGGVVDQDIHLSMLRDDLFGEALQGGLVGEIPHEVIILQQVDDTDRSACGLQLLTDAPPDPPRAARDHGDLSRKIYLHKSFFPSEKACPTFSPRVQ